MSSSIYIITNKVNSKTYIGKTTKSIQERFDAHCYNSLKKNQNTYLYKAIRKYGVENFTISLLEETTPDLLNEREIHWISKLNPNYNMTKGGDGGDTSNSPNYKIGMSRVDRSGPNNSMYGRKRPDTAIYLNNAKDKMIRANRCPVICEDVKYISVGEAQEAYPGINIRKRLDNPKYPNFYRLRPRTKRNQS